MYYDIEPCHHGNGILQSVFGFLLLFLCYTQCCLVISFPESLLCLYMHPLKFHFRHIFPIQTHLPCSPLSKLTYIISHSLKLWDIHIDTFINICILWVFCFLRKGMSNLGILRTGRRPVREAYQRWYCLAPASWHVPLCVQFQYPVSAHNKYFRWHICGEALAGKERQRCVLKEASWWFLIKEEISHRTVLVCYWNREANEYTFIPKAYKYTLALK